MTANGKLIAELSSQLLGLFSKQDLRVDVFRGQLPTKRTLKATGMLVKVTHLPTGRAESCGEYLTRAENELVALSRLVHNIFKSGETEQD